MTESRAESPWSLVVPVKRLASAKSRLARHVGEHRADLALAVACDTVMAAVSCPRVTEVFAVTDDDRAAEALDSLGARVLADEPGSGLNPALAHGAAEAERVHPDAGRCAMSADLPALRAIELDRALREAARHERSFLADTPGIGTTLYAAARGVDFSPAFGVASRRRHRDSGAVELRRDGVPTVCRDVDTPDDLRAAAALGVGPHTAKLVAGLGL